MINGDNCICFFVSTKPTKKSAGRHLAVQGSRVPGYLQLVLNPTTSSSWQTSHRHVITWMISAYRRWEKRWKLPQSGLWFVIETPEGTRAGRCENEMGKANEMTLHVASYKTWIWEEDTLLRNMTIIIKIIDLGIGWINTKKEYVWNITQFVYIYNNFRCYSTSVFTLSIVSMYSSWFFCVEYTPATFYKGDSELSLVKDHLAGQNLCIMYELSANVA